MRTASRLADTLRPLWVGCVVIALAAPPPQRFPLSHRDTAVLAVLLILLWALAGWAEHAWWRPTPLDLPWAIWLLLIPVTLWATAAPELTHAALRLFVAQTLAFWGLVTWVRDPRRAGWATTGFLLLGSALAVLGLFWMQWPTGYIFAVPERLQALRQHYSLPLQESVNENILAGTLVPLWGFSLGAAVAPRGRWRWPLRLLGLLSSLIMGGTIVLSQSRGSWVGGLAAVYVFISLSWRPAWLSGLALLAALAVLHRVGILLPLLNATLALGQTGSLAGRAELWSRALYAMQDFVFTGIGMGTFPRVIPLLYPLFLYSPTSEVPHAHNLFLQVGVDLGLFGLVAFVAMVLNTGILLHKGMQRAVHNRDDTSLWLLRGDAAGLVAMFAHGLVDAATWNVRPSFVVWALWGLWVGTALTLCAQGHDGRTSRIAERSD